MRAASCYNKLSTEMGVTSVTKVGVAAQEGQVFVAFTRSPAPLDRAAAVVVSSKTALQPALHFWEHFNPGVLHRYSESFLWLKLKN